MNSLAKWWLNLTNDTRSSREKKGVVISYSYAPIEIGSAFVQVVPSTHPIQVEHIYNMIVGCRHGMEPIFQLFQLESSPSRHEPGYHALYTADPINCP